MSLEKSIAYSPQPDGLYLLQSVPRKSAPWERFFVMAWPVDGWLQRWLDSCRFEDPAQYLHGQKLHAAAFEFMSVEALPLNEVDFFFHWMCLDG
ncbi:hypothetical protein [Comamonas testosteroni]|uniref:hypothetical protein n=1 Tax=Comamonas testosteroni TaxID=285 RepID=UPI00391C6EFC